MTEERLAEIKMRTEAATPGPWLVDASDSADALFMAHARQDIPDLLAEVERQQRQITELRSMLSSKGGQ